MHPIHSEETGMSIEGSLELTSVFMFLNRNLTLTTKDVAEKQGINLLDVHEFLYLPRVRVHLQE